MGQIDNLMLRAEVLAAKTGLSLSTISRKILNDGKGLARLKNGGQCTVKTLHNALHKLHALERQAEQKDVVPEVKTKASSALPHLDRLEAESIHILREVAASCKNPVMLYSIGKDSSVMLHLALKAFYPAKPPFPFLHVDTLWKFQEMISFRDRLMEKLGLKLHVYTNSETQNQNITPFNTDSSHYTDMAKTQALKQALDKYGFDAAFGGARRDEEKSRAKERVFSFRNAKHNWDPKNQRPELWNIYNTKLAKGESLRVFPLSNWTELDVWQYIERENIELPSLYFSKKRPVVERDGLLIMVDDERMVLEKGETAQQKMVRFRTLGCYPLTGAVESDANSVAGIIAETKNTNHSERQGRAIDKGSESDMETKKREGYF